MTVSPWRGCHALAHFVVQRCGALAVFFFLSSCPALAGFLTDESTEPWVEGNVDFPAQPSEVNLMPFYVSKPTPNVFMVDGTSVSVADDGVVRYVLVVRSPAGAENVTFEGIRCATGEQRIYATGRSDGAWVAARESAWKRISFNSYNRAQAALAQDYFCDGPAAVLNAEEALRRLKQGGASGARGNGMGYWGR